MENGFTVENEDFKADALFLDVPNPWSAITHTKNIIKKRTEIT